MMRVDPCRCGCKGNDPWHRASFKRAVWAVQLLDEPQLTNDLDGYCTTYVVATAVIKAPWGEQDVQLRVRVHKNGRLDWSNWQNPRL